MAHTRTQLLDGIMALIEGGRQRGTLAPDYIHLVRDQIAGFLEAMLDDTIEDATYHNYRDNRIALPHVDPSLYRVIYGAEAVRIMERRFQLDQSTVRHAVSVKGNDQ